MAALFQPKDNAQSSAFGQEKLVELIRKRFENFPDARTGKNVTYEMSDAALSAFAVFFMQNPSFLAQQKLVETAHGRSNLQTLFGAHKIPCDNQIRSLLDSVPPETIYPLFTSIFQCLQDCGYFKPFLSLKKTLLVAVDGIEYFSSQKIHCEQCSTQTLKNAHIHYSHKAITPTVVSPNSRQVIPLSPEFILPQDGHDKQDCELTASMRWLAREHSLFGTQAVTILGDDLFSHQPYCEQILGNDWHFILVCKPDSHQTLYQAVADFEKLEKIQTLSQIKWHGSKRIVREYRYVNQVPLRKSDDALMVNWCEIKEINAKGQVVYHNSFITDFEINEHNIIEIVEAGRTRWKIENENNNTLKTKGYSFEHNFGHGKQHLASVLATLILLAFLSHTVLEFFDACYRLLRKHLSSRKMFFDDIRALTRYLCFEGWKDLLIFMLTQLKIPIPT